MVVRMGTLWRTADCTTDWMTDMSAAIATASVTPRFCHTESLAAPTTSRAAGAEGLPCHPHANTAASRGSPSMLPLRDLASLDLSASLSPRRPRRAADG